jgi:hypothetical protein
VYDILEAQWAEPVSLTFHSALKESVKVYCKNCSFVTVRIPIVDRASGDLPRLLCRVDDIIGKDASLYKLSCEFGVLNSYYDTGDIELLTRKVETSHWKKEEISLHAAAKQASFSLASKRCKCKGTYRTKMYDKKNHYLTLRSKVKATMTSFLNSDFS